MGNQQPQQYTVPVSQKKDGESAIYRHSQFPNQLIDKFHGETTVQGMFLHAVNTYPNNRCIGKQVVTGQNSKHYVYKTFAECHAIAQKLGSGMLDLNLIPETHEYQGQQLKMVGVFSKNREEWLLLEFANILYGNTMIPLYDTLGLESIPYILEQTKLVTLFISAGSVDTILKVDQLHHLKNIVSYDILPEEQVQRLQQKNLNYYHFDQVLGACTTIRPNAQITANDIFTFSYTSGTTGMPKGVMLKHHSFVSVAAAVQYQGFSIFPTDVYLSYLPLPHVLERVIVTALLGYGACICMYGGDVQKIKDDLQLVRPTIFASVPRLYRRLYTAIKDNLDKLTGYKKKIAEQAVATKLYYVQKGGHVTHRLWDQLVFNQTKAAFGGRIRLMVSGSAPMSPEVMDFLKIAVCSAFLEGYGQTEGTGGSFISRPDDPITGHVGGCLPNIEFKVIDVPEMKYFSTDKDEQGRDTPRGEICIRGHGVFSGYYKEDEKTKETLDKDGWMHSGDIGMIRPDGSLKIIDRVKNIFKLSQGEYIAPEKVEDVYLKVKGVTEVFVYGDSTKSCCIAFIVPDKHYVMKLGQELHIEGNFEELCLNPQIVKHFFDNMVAKGKEYKLNGMENVKKIYVENKAFQEYGLMSNTLKMMRHTAKKHYQDQIEQMYKGME